MNVLYLHKKSDWGCKELKFSLRSVEKYINPDKVYVVGYIPNWLTSVEHVPHQAHQRRYIDVIQRLKKGVRAVQSERAILMHDDIFLLKPYEPVMRYNGTLKDRMKRTEGDRKQVFINSLDVDENLTNYCLHYPLPFNRHDMLDIITGMELAGKKMYSYMSLYGSYDKTFPHVESEDCKYQIPTEKNLQSLPCFSTHSENDKLESILLKLYPNKSKFEL